MEKLEKRAVVGALLDILWIPWDMSFAYLRIIELLLNIKHIFLNKSSFEKVVQVGRLCSRGLSTSNKAISLYNKFLFKNNLL